MHIHNPRQQLKLYIMKRTPKMDYEAPLIQVYEVSYESVICVSGDTEKYHNGESYNDDDFNS